jgi:hypothetical protein
MKNYPQNNEHKPGTWKGLLVGPQNIRKASFTCPICGNACSLSDHEIAPDGTVSPSLICPYGCGFHEFIHLDGWMV